jgi:hypothetical protein
VFALVLLHFLVNKTNLSGDENTGEKSEMNDKENNESETRTEAKNDGENKNVTNLRFRVHRMIQTNWEHEFRFDRIKGSSI